MLVEESHEEMYVSVAIFTMLAMTYRIGTVARCTDFIVWQLEHEEQYVPDQGYSFIII